MKKSSETIGQAWMREIRDVSAVAVDKSNFLESEFGAGLMVGVGGSGLVVALAENPTNWLFVGGSVASLLSGLVIFFMLKAGSRESDDF